MCGSADVGVKEVYFVLVQEELRAYYIYYLKKRKKLNENIIVPYRQKYLSKGNNSTAFIGLLWKLNGFMKQFYIYIYKLWFFASTSFSYYYQ